MALTAGEVTRLEPELVAGRYRVEARLARGGMGAVYRAHDRVRGRPVALKRLVADADARRRARMFEREYHTLAGLKHPRIIEVYEYGVDERGAYYTMELLDGRDLRELAPVPYRAACSYLRDVASSLALLHARRLLHRDLSPRNVRITSDARAKLIDFGALTGFGRNPTVVGTPPLVPPEGLYGAALDQRADLYSLGALSYWVLTGRHAFEVKRIDELQDAWNTHPLPPSALAPADAEGSSFPDELDHLVLSLLSRDPMARPSSAAEVIERLSVIAGLPPDQEPLSALSYLHGGKTIGRTRERAKLRKRLKAALGGAGSAVAIEAETGMGSGRILHDLAIGARLQGAVAVVVDAAQGSASYAVLEEIAHALFAALPHKAPAAMGEHQAALARFVPGRGRHSTRLSAVSSESGGGDPRELRLRTQTALLAWLEALCAEVPLLIAVHNFHHADESSAALLAALARRSARGRLLLALAFDPSAVPSAAPALADVRQHAARIGLLGLDEDEVRALVEATFGAVPGSERLAARLHEATEGKPQACLDLMQHLVEQGVIAFAGGVWALPQELDLSELTAGRDHVLDERLARLDPDARRLMALLCVHRGPLPLERLESLAALERLREPLKLLSLLERHGVAVCDEEGARFVHRRMHAAAQHLLDEPERRRLHALLGAELLREEADDVETRLEAGWHLLEGGEERRGADLLAEMGSVLSLDADGMAAALPALRAALAAFRRQGRSKREQARLLASLVMSGFYVDRKLVDTYGDDAVAALQDVLGLSLARRLRPLLGRRLGDAIGLSVGLLRSVIDCGPRRALAAYKELATTFTLVIVFLTSAWALMLDAERAQHYAELLAPLRVLGADHAVEISYRYACALARLPEDRIADTLAACRKLLARVDGERPIRDMAPVHRSLIRGALLYSVGALETFRGDPEALRFAAELERSTLFMHELYAAQIRANYHGVRGELAEAERWVRRVELLARQAGSGWQADVWAPSSALLCNVLTGDLIGAKRVAAQLASLAREIPSLELHARGAVGFYTHLRGEHQRSSDIAAATIASVPPRSFIGWTTLIAGQMSSLTPLGRAEEARRLGLQTLALLDAEDRGISAMVVTLVTELARAEAELGELDVAASRLEAFLTELGEGGGPAVRATLHEARAQVALLAGDGPAARLHLSLMERCARPTGHPALIARCERLRRALDAGDGHALVTSRATLDLALPAEDELIALVRRFEGKGERHDCVLDLLLEHTGASSGALFGCEDGELVLLSPLGEETADALRAHARARQELEHRAREDAVTLAQSVTPHAESVRGQRCAAAAEPPLVAFMLEVAREHTTAPVAVAVLRPAPEPLREPPASLLRALGEALSEPLSASTEANPTAHAALEPRSD